MSDEIFLRNYRLKIGRSTGSRVYEMRPNETIPDQDGLRLTFQVTHFAGGAFSVAEITIYNVSRYASRQMLGDGSTGKYEFISLEAGYDGLFGSIFVGQITNVQIHLEDGGSTRGIRFFCKSSAKERDLNLINLTPYRSLRNALQCSAPRSSSTEISQDSSADRVARSSRAALPPA